MCNFSTIFLLLFSVCLFSQDQKQDSIAEFEKSFNSLSYQELLYKVSYIEDKKTLYFETIEAGKTIIAYKLLIVDIHPKGIFLCENNGLYSIRVLSLDNGNVFIKENFDKKYRYSNTTNYVDIGLWPKNYKSDLVMFIAGFEKFIGNKKNFDSYSDDEEIIVTDKKN